MGTLADTEKIFSDFKAKWKDYDDYEYSARRIRQFEALQNSKIPDFFKRYDKLTQKLKSKWFWDKIAPKSVNQRISLLPYMTKKSLGLGDFNKNSFGKRFLNSLRDERLGDPDRAGFMAIHLDE